MAPNNATDWFQRADSDLLNIDNNLKSSKIPWDTIAFHAHQAIEKYMKGLLVANGVSPRRTHDLVELIADCSGYAQELLAFEQECRLITRLYVACRYPEASAPGETDARNSVKVAGQIKLAVLKNYKP